MKKTLLITSSILITPLIITPIVSCSNSNGKILPEGEYKNSETGLWFKVNDKGEATITEWEKNIEELTIPEYIEFNSVLSSEYYGYKAKVAAVAKNAMVNSSLKRVTLPSQCKYYRGPSGHSFPSGIKVSGGILVG